jgi:hypothetical protein
VWQFRSSPVPEGSILGWSVAEQVANVLWVSVKGQRRSRPKSVIL